MQVRTVSAKYIMKGDDDTFVRVDAIINEAKKVPENKSLYIGNINYYHKPLRSGKWAVAYEVLLKPSLSCISPLVITFFLGIYYLISRGLTCVPFILFGKS